MKSGRIFFPYILRAVVFAGLLLTPVLGFAEDKIDVDAAVKEFDAEYEKISKDNVSPEVINKAEAQKSEIIAKTKEIKELEEKAAAAKAKEQSTGNKMLGGLSIGAAGIGGMQLAQGMAEKKADDESAAAMNAYLNTIKCGVNGARDVPYNEAGITPAESRQLADARLEYTVIAKKMKTAKESLGLAPGIEAELIIDTTKGLYDNSGTDTGGITHNFDTATQRAAEGGGTARAQVGGVLAAGGVIGGLVGNNIINSEKSGSEKSGDSKDSKSGGGIKDLLGDSKSSGLLDKAKDFVGK